MRISVLLLVLILLGGLSAAQDTNFASGPQYLMTSGSPLFARSIATPSLSLGEQPAPAFREPASAPGAIDAEVAATIELERDLSRYSIYYGVPLRESVVEISGSNGRSSETLPMSIRQMGVADLVDANALKLRGIGVTLPEASAYWKAHKLAASHRYTNADIERIREKEKK